MRVWKDLGVVETIYEEEHEDSNSPSISSPLTAPPTPLESRVETWILATGFKTDVFIHVQDRCFRLHKDPLTSRSGYLKRHLAESSEITLSPPLKITAETFSVVADFCYDSHIVITPFNVAALRIAAELLDMTEENHCGGGGGGEGNLRMRTETYFCQAVSVNQEYAAVVLRSCLALLPEAEATAFLVSRCIEALGLTDDVDGFNSWVDDLITLAADVFQMIGDSMHERFTRNHDILYKIVDLYLKEQTGKITEEQKTRICGTVDCNKLSPHLLMHAIQNPRMPLRFIVRAMLVEQLNNRCSVVSASAGRRQTPRPHSNEVVTLGAILRRDMALRQVAQLKTSMEATSSRIRSLERELMGMKKLLRESEKRREVLESGRSASFRFSSENKIVRGERGSTSSATLRFSDRGERGGFSSSEGSCDGNSLRSRKSFGWKLMNGLKSAFRTSPSKSDPESRTSSKVGVDEDEHGNGDGDEEVVIKEDRPLHRRSRSLV